MGILGKMFEKKICDVCGEEIKLLGNRKLEDGNLCKNCANKLSPWFDERRHSTVEQIKQQLAYREANQSKVSAFHSNLVYGLGSQKLFVDTSANKFTVASDKDLSGGNPDILDFADATACDLDIRENRTEEKRTVDGKSVSYVPPRYKYSYDFYVTIRVNNPYFDDMKFKINSFSVDTGNTCMTAGGNTGWKLSTNAGLRANMNINKYNECISIGDNIKNMITGWMNQGPVQPASYSLNMTPDELAKAMQAAAGQAAVAAAANRPAAGGMFMNQGAPLQGAGVQPMMGQGFPQHGMQQGFAGQPMMGQGFPQQGMQQGFAGQPMMNQGVPQQPVQRPVSNTDTTGGAIPIATVKCPYCDATITPVGGKCPVCEGVL